MNTSPFKGALHSRKTPRKLFNGSRIKSTLYKNIFKERHKSITKPIVSFIPDSKYQ